jgi:hypothetical protein
MYFSIQMNQTKHYPLLFISLLFLMTGKPLNAQVTTLLHQAFSTDGASTIRINIDEDNIKIKETKGSRVIIETRISISLPNKNLLDFIAGNGRYDLIKSYDTSTKEIVLSSKDHKNVLIVKGEVCEEMLDYIIYIPPTLRYEPKITN